MSEITTEAQRDALAARYSQAIARLAEAVDAIDALHREHPCVQHGPARASVFMARVNLEARLWELGQMTFPTPAH